ncbi:FumA C-terminus/TtdB family hydratase beta subunit [Acidaminobacter sp.]|uniref:FumA C-terminus/TtdB family hydratase beta subunit n=1 Tax=Acidaminobacter sp. TaxID=1872102 RepID=UPI002ED28664
MKEYYMNLPLTKDKLKDLEIGDIVYLTGYLYTARDAAHKRIENFLLEGKQPPVDFQDISIFYAGPCPTKPGRTMGSIAPTTSMRMDNFVEMTFELGMSAMIGKGDRSEYVAELCKKYSGVYLLSIGGASALISEQVKTCDVVAFEDLGTESIKKLYVENLRVIVGIDTKGQVFQDQEIAKYRKSAV